MHAGLLRPLRPIVALVALCAACGDTRSADAEDSVRTGSATAVSEPAAVPAAGAHAWIGPLAMRGTLEKGRSVAGQLSLTPLESGAAGFDEVSARVRQTYPAYTGPYYTAQLALAAGADSIRGTFRCAHGPATPPPLVCHPIAPMAGLEDATLVVQADGRAILTGSHGEGVSVEFGRFTWTRPGS